MRVLITGASGGLGTGVIDQFLAQGDTVLGVARSWRSAPPGIQTIAADLSRPEDCERMAQEAGAVDALIHVMGGFAGGTPTAQTSVEVWDQMMTMNLRSAFLVVRAVLPGMMERKRGRIVAIGSRAGVEPSPGLSGYAVSKAGLVHLIRTVAAELKGTDLTANIVLPSTIDTAANRSALPHADPSKWVTPEAIAKVVAWLASDAAKEINGAVIPVYGKA